MGQLPMVVIRRRAQRDGERDQGRLPLVEIIGHGFLHVTGAGGRDRPGRLCQAPATRAEAAAGIGPFFTHHDGPDTRPLVRPRGKQKTRGNSCAADLARTGRPQRGKLVAGSRPNLGPRGAGSIRQLAGEHQRGGTE